MAKLTYKQILLNYLRENQEWTYEYQLSNFETKWGWVGNRGQRDVREMVKDGLLEKRLEGKYCQVRYPENPCSSCGRVSNTKLPNGKWYCTDCFEDGLEDEKQAMGYYEEPLF